VVIAAQPEAALEKAKAMVPRVLASKRLKQFQRIVIQFFEAVILYQFPHWSRKEIEKMLQVGDVRQTRVYE
jgi:predicted transposase YdaD